MARTQQHDDFNPSMTPSNVSVAVELAYQRRAPVMLWGPPGVGKSQVVEQVAKKLGIDLIDRRLSQMEPSDLIGYGMVADDETKFATPNWLPKTGKGILFLDEITSAAPSMMAAGYQLVLDRKLGAYKLPKGWVVIAAGNRTSDRSIAYEMPKALANRFSGHYTVKTSVADFVEHAKVADFHPDVINYIRARPEMLHRFDPKSKEQAFPTPRSWEFCSDIVKQKPPASISFQLYQGCVGEATAIDFTAWQELKDNLPKASEIVNTPEKALVPQKADELYAVASLLTFIANPDTFNSVVQYAERLPREYMACAILDATARNEALRETTAFVDWATRNKNLI